jgi:hypothetical protein
MIRTVSEFRKLWKFANFIFSELSNGSNLIYPKSLIPKTVYIKRINMKIIMLFKIGKKQ